MHKKRSRGMTRRSFLHAVGLTGVGAALVACVPVTPAAPGGEDRSAPEMAFLNYWTGWSGFEYDALQVQVDKFNAAHEDDVYANMSTVFGQYDKVLTAIAGGNPPDVVSAVWLHQLVSMAARDGLQPITAYAADSGVTGQEYFPQLWDAWHWNGELWGAMITSNSNVVAYRPDLFMEVGLDPDAPPVTLDELDAASMALEMVDDNGAIQQVGLMPSGLSWWGRVFGGQFYDEESGKITADSAPIVDALSWMASYSARLGIDEVATFQSGFGDYMSTQNPLFAGKEAMKQVGEWFIQFNNRFAPDLEIRMIPAPYPSGGRPNCTNFGGSVFTIPTGVMHPDASWSLIDFLSQEEVMADFCFNIFNIPPKVAAAQQARFMDEPRFALAVELLNGANAFGPDKIPVNDFLNSRLSEAESSVLTGQATTEETLQRVTVEVQEELDRTMARMS